MSVSFAQPTQGQIQLKGELNMQSVPALARQLKDLIETTTVEQLCFDLSQISRSDSAGLALLIECMRLAQLRGIGIMFQQLPEQMRQIAQVSELLEVLPIQADSD